MTWESKQASEVVGQSPGLEGPLGHGGPWRRPAGRCGFTAGRVVPREQWASVPPLSTATGTAGTGVTPACKPERLGFLKRRGWNGARTLESSGDCSTPHPGGAPAVPRVHETRERPGTAKVWKFAPEAEMSLTNVAVFEGQKCQGPKESQAEIGQTEGGTHCRVSLACGVKQDGTKPARRSRKDWWWPGWGEEVGGVGGKVEGSVSSAVTHPRGAGRALESEG